MGDYPFSTEDVLNLLGISHKTRGSTTDIPCIACDDHSRHLNVNLKKGVMRCNKCGFSGNILTLYAELTNMTTKEAYRDIMEKLRLSEKPQTEISYLKRQQKERREAMEAQMNTLASIDKRNDTYHMLLAMLDLKEAHRKNLLLRGFDEVDYLNLEYKSFPQDSLQKYAALLQEQGAYLKGVPGFYQTEQGKWSINQYKSCIMIPVRNINNKIEGIQCRIDESARYITTRGKRSPKYYWLSSYDMKGGTKTQAYVHYACDFRWNREEYEFYPVLKKNGFGEVCVALTEGPLKADLTHILTGMPMIAVPGVSQRTLLEKELYKLKKMGLQTVYNLFDMDFETTPEVAKAVEMVRELILKMGLKYHRAEWNHEFKGCDDYYAYKIKGIDNRRS